MASSAAATAACRAAAAPSRHPDAVAAVAAGRYRKTTAAGLWNVKSTTGCIRRRRSNSIETRRSAERAARTLKLQEQQEKRVQSSCSGFILLPPRCETQTATDGTRETKQQIFNAAATASSLATAAAGCTADMLTAASSRFRGKGRLADHTAGRHLPQTAAAAANYSREAVFWTSAETTISNDEKLSLKTFGALLSSAAGRSSTAGTRAWPAIQRSIAAEESLKRIFVKDVYSFAIAIETQSACETSTLKMLEIEGKRLRQPRCSRMCVTGCAKTVRPTTVLALHSRSSSYSRSIGCLLAGFCPMKNRIKSRMSVFTEEATPPLAAAASRTVVASDSSIGLLPSSAAVAVPRSTFIVAAPQCAAAASVLRPAPVRAFSSLHEGAAAVGDRVSTASAPASAAATIDTRPTASGLTTWVVASLGIAARSPVCASAGAAATSAATSAGSSRTVATVASSAAGSRVVTLPLGTLYSKTHEYVRLLLEFVGPRYGSSGAAVAVAPWEGKEEGAANSSSRRQRRCRLVGFVGLSVHAAEELGEVVYCEYTHPIAAAAALAADIGEANDAAQWRQQQQQQQQKVLAGRDDVTEKAEDTRRTEQEMMWVRRGSPVCSLESVKSVAEAYSPVEGIILAVNTATAGDPAVVWRDPEEEGWLVKLLLPLPAGRTSQRSSDDESKQKDFSSALFLTDADIDTAAWEKVLGGPIGAVEKQAEGEGAGNYEAGGRPTVATLQEVEDTGAFMEACENCVRLQDALVGLRRRLMGPQQYTQFVEREKKSRKTES